MPRYKFSRAAGRHGRPKCPFAVDAGYSDTVDGPLGGSVLEGNRSMVSLRAVLPQLFRRNTLNSGADRKCRLFVGVLEVAVFGVVGGHASGISFGLPAGRHRQRNS